MLNVQQRKYLYYGNTNFTQVNYINVLFLLSYETKMHAYC